MSFSTAFIMAALFPLPLMHDSERIPSFKKSVYEENNGQVIHTQNECYLAPDTILNFIFETQRSVTIKGHNHSSIIIDEKVVLNRRNERGQVRIRRTGKTLDQISLSIKNKVQAVCTITPRESISYNYHEYIIYVPHSARIICKADDYIKIMDMKNSVYVEGNFIALENLTGPETTVVNLGPYNHTLFFKNITGLLKIYSTTPSSLPYDAQTFAHLQMYPLSERPEKPTN